MKLQTKQKQGNSTEGLRGLVSCLHFCLTPSRTIRKTVSFHLHYAAFFLNEKLFLAETWDGREAALRGGPRRSGAKQGGAGGGSTLLLQATNLRLFLESVAVRVFRHLS